MLASLASKFAVFAAIAAAIAALVVWVKIDTSRIDALKVQLASAQLANKQFATAAAEQNKKIGDLLQATQDLQNKAAAAAATVHERTIVRTQTIEKAVVPKECNAAIEWAKSQAPSLSVWSSSPAVAQ